MQSSEHDDGSLGLEASFFADKDRIPKQQRKVLQKIVLVFLKQGFVGESHVGGKAMAIFSEQVCILY